MRPEILLLRWLQWSSVLKDSQAQYSDLLSLFLLSILAKLIYFQVFLSMATRLSSLKRSRNGRYDCLPRQRTQKMSSLRKHCKTKVLIYQNLTIHIVLTLTNTFFSQKEEPDITKLKGVWEDHMLLSTSRKKLNKELSLKVQL